MAHSPPSAIAPNSTRPSLAIQPFPSPPRPPRRTNSVSNPSRVHLPIQPTLISRHPSAQTIQPIQLSPHPTLLKLHRSRPRSTGPSAAVNLSTPMATRGDHPHFRNLFMGLFLKLVSKVHRKTGLQCWASTPQCDQTPPAATIPAAHRIHAEPG